MVLNEQIVKMLLLGIRDTLYMTILSTLCGYLIGLPMGVALNCSSNEGIKPNRYIYRVLDLISNLVRSVPFLILLILLIPLTRMIVGKSYGPLPL